MRPLIPVVALMLVQVSACVTPVPSPPPADFEAAKVDPTSVASLLELASGPHRNASSPEHGVLLAERWRMSTNPGAAISEFLEVATDEEIEQLVDGLIAQLPSSTAAIMLGALGPRAARSAPALEAGQLWDYCVNVRGITGPLASQHTHAFNLVTGENRAFLSMEDPRFDPSDCGEARI